MIHLCTSAMKRRQKNARREAKIKNHLVSGRVNGFNSWLAVGVHSKLGNGGGQNARPILRTTVCVLVHNRVGGRSVSLCGYHKCDWMMLPNIVARTPVATPNRNPNIRSFQRSMVINRNLKLYRATSAAPRCVMR